MATIMYLYIVFTLRHFKPPKGVTHAKPRHTSDSIRSKAAAHNREILSSRQNLEIERNGSIHEAPFTSVSDVIERIKQAQATLRHSSQFLIRNTKQTCGGPRKESIDAMADDLFLLASLIRYYIPCSRVFYIYIYSKIKNLILVDCG